jgi:hypothetical protein
MQSIGAGMVRYIRALSYAWLASSLLISYAAPKLSWSPAQNVPTSEGFWAVSCPSAVFCDATSGGEGNEVFIYKSGAWSVVPVGSMKDLNWDVTCPKYEFCVFSAHGGWVVALDAGRWTAQYQVFPHGGSPLVSCPTTGYCLSLDSVQSGGHATAEMAVFEHGKWSTPLPVPGIVQGASLSCPSAGFCMTTAGSGETNGSVETPGYDQVATYQDGT